ncbi:hypothetical protein N1851_015449 [Merluccius polli]|uniref:SCAN box domain-containing protein n=1 Tax=Merluccius polli TaxID=89951 RepID=A0AA47P2T1_MERPO|nr:hypothetical protein N1851_015449 [Merluccius polli]
MSAYDDFLAAPSESLLVALTKEQLMQVADHYLIEWTIPKRSNKEQLVDFIHERLKEKQVLPGGSPVESTAPTPVPDLPGPIRLLLKMDELTFDERKQLLQMQLDQTKLEMEQRKFEMEHKKWELGQELEQRKIEAVESEKGRLLEMERLQHTEREQEQVRELERIRLRLAAEDIRSGSAGAALRSDLGSMIKFLPRFNERDPDVFFSLFENIAADQNWSNENKTLLLQTVLVGRAQEAFVAMSFEDRRSYVKVKEAVLKSYELVPEAYRQRFRNLRKFERQTYSEVARELTNSFNRWLTAEGVYEFDGLCDLMIMEQFKNILPERLAMYLNEHKVQTAAEAAVLADSYVLTHKNQLGLRDFSQRYDHRRVDRDHQRDVATQGVRGNAGPPGRFDPRNKSDADSRCHYCRGLGHWKMECPSLHRKGSPTREVKDVCCATSIHAAHLRNDQKVHVCQSNAAQTDCEHFEVPNEREHVKEMDDEPKATTMFNYAPFITEGFVSMVGDAQRVPVKILRDTGASESFICQSSLPFSSLSDTGSVVLIRGIGLQPFPVPLHRIQLQSGFVNGEVIIAVRPTLPIDNIDMIIGNNLGGDCVWPETSCPPPVVKSIATASEEPDKCLVDFPEVFTACAVTRAMARAQTEKASDVSKTGAAKVCVPELPTSLSPNEIINAQKNDHSLENYFALVWFGHRFNVGWQRRLGQGK